MATTSTVPTVLDTLITQINSNLPSGVSAFEAWPGPSAAAEMVVFGEINWDDYRIATIKAGRKQRQEDWSVGFEVFVMGQQGSTPADPSPCRDRAFTILTELEDLLADTPRLGLAAGSVQRTEVRLNEAGPRVFEKGWGYRIAGRVAVFARLL